MSAVLAWIMGSKLGRYIGGALLIVAAIFGFRAKWKGEGRQDERAKQAAKAAETQRRMQDANADARARDVRDRLRDHDF